MASYALQRHLGWRKQSRLGQNITFLCKPSNLWSYPKMSELFKIIVRDPRSQYPDFLELWISYLNKSCSYADDIFANILDLG